MNLPVDAMLSLSKDGDVTGHDFEHDCGSQLNCPPLSESLRADPFCSTDQ